MFISKKPPVELVAGDILAPESLNENNAYIAEAFQFEADKQTARWTTTYQLVPTVTTAITSATANIDMLMSRRIPPNNFRVQGTTGGTAGSSKTANSNIESVTIVIYYEATVAFEIAIKPNGAASSERIEFPIRDASLATEPYTATRLMNININTEDLFRVRAIGATAAGLPAGVTISKFDVTVGFSSDRYDSGDDSDSTITKPTLFLAQYTDTTPPDASVFAALQANLNIDAAIAKSCFPYRWCAVDYFDITSATDLRLRLKPILNAWIDASFSSVTSNPRIIGVWMDANLSTVTAGNISFGLANAAGAVFASFQHSVPVASSVQAGKIGVATLRPSPADVTPIVNDYYLSLTVAGGNTVKKATVYLLLQ